MLKTNPHEVNMNEGAILPKFLAMAIPLVFSMVLQFLFNAADLVIVGNFASEHSLAAIGSTLELIGLNLALFAGVSLGADARIAFGRGEGDDPG